MKRTFEAVDIMVAIGFCATILGGFLFVMVSGGVIGSPAGETISSAQAISEMELVEPALGKAIVSQALLDLSTDKETVAAAAQLNRATMLSYELQSGPDAILDETKAWAERMEADSIARAELVKGRAIVNFTKRGISQGWLSADQYINQYNDRMIQQADVAGSRVADSFASTWQVNLGEAIVGSTVAYMQAADRIQEGIGAAIVRVTKAQSGYEEASGAIQVQTAALFNAAIRTELQADEFTQLARVETAPEATMATGMSKPWPEISSGHLVGAVLGLMGLLIAGFYLGSRPSEEVMPYTRMEPAERVFRKTA
ncbi:hypothetical protein [Nitrospira sp. Nam80]